LGALRGIKEERALEGRETLIGVAGCVAQAEGEEIMRRAPAVDLVIGPQTYHRLPQRGREGPAARRSSRPSFRRKTSSRPAGAARKAVRARRHRLPHRAGRLRQVLHLLRGALHARRGVLAPGGADRGRGRKLAEAGVREFTLLGQNVNAWHGTGPDGRRMGLGRLCSAAAEIEGIARLRYTTSHPRDMDDDLIAAHRDLAS
jgi:tRNA-2-methylthio-N6-dimethylallyladenosine synthase